MNTWNAQDTGVKRGVFSKIEDNRKAGPGSERGNAREPWVQGGLELELPNLTVMQHHHAAEKSVLGFV